MKLMTLVSMGQYGWYVWPAYGLTLFVFAMNGLAYFREKKQIKKIFNKTHKSS